MNRTTRDTCKKVAISLLLIATMWFTGSGAYLTAHMPGSSPAPEFSLDPIMIRDGGNIFELTPELLGKYHNDMAIELTRKKLAKLGKTTEEIDKAIGKQFAGETGICVCGMSAYRAVLYASTELWQDGIVNRSELVIVCHWLGPAARDFSVYMTGTANNVPNVTEPGEFRFQYHGNSIPANISQPDLKALSIDMDIGSMGYRIMNSATGDYVDLKLAEEIVPKDFFELRKIAKFEENPDKTIVDAFRTGWEELRDNLLTKSDWEIFEGVNEPAPSVPVLPIVVLGGLMLVILIMWIVSRLRGF